MRVYRERLVYEAFGARTPTAQRVAAAQGHLPPGGSSLVDGPSAAKRMRPAKAGSSSCLASGPVARATRTTGLLPRAAGLPLPGECAPQ